MPRDTTLTPERERARELLRERLILIMEDGPLSLADITEALQTERGTAGQTDAGIFTVSATKDLPAVLAAMQTQLAPGSRLMLIADFEMPTTFNARPQILNGILAIRDIQNAVAEWNQKHENTGPVELEIFLNSLETNDEEGWQDFKKRYDHLAGTNPKIRINFANIKGRNQDENSKASVVASIMDYLAGQAK
ncbi:MAG: hypothetical protein Q7K39_04110 [Candidatus Magasanikbacteria bacterium]|nr:hypothetical protein [Candidatus Magasanikbacteria bacterium]